MPSGSTRAARRPSAWTHDWVARLDVGVPIFFLLSGFLLYRPFVRARAADASAARAPSTPGGACCGSTPATGSRSSSRCWRSASRACSRRATCCCCSRTRRTRSPPACRRRGRCASRSRSTPSCRCGRRSCGARTRRSCRRSRVLFARLARLQAGRARHGRGRTRRRGRPVDHRAALLLGHVRDGHGARGDLDAPRRSPATPRCGGWPPPRSSSLSAKGAGLAHPSVEGFTHTARSGCATTSTRRSRSAPWPPG